MASFTLDGVAYEYLRSDPGHDPEAAHSWAYGKYPKVMATVPLTSGTVNVYAFAERWNPSHILVSWQDDKHHAHWAWIPAGNIRRVTDSEWDIEEYRRCPENLRGNPVGLSSARVPNDLNAGSRSQGTRLDPVMRQHCNMRNSPVAALTTLALEAFRASESPFPPLGFRTPTLGHPVLDGAPELHE